MKQLFVILGILALVTASCKKDNTAVYTQEQLNGTWEALALNSNGCTEQLLITSTGLSEIKICAGIRVKFDAENYSFDGRIIKYKLYGINMEFQISELTDQKLMLGYNDPVEYKRVAD